VADPEQPLPDSGLELARKPGAAPPPRPSSPRASTPSLQAVRSANRAEPLAGTKEKEKVKDRAVDVILNAFGLLRDMADDFKHSDRFFKYKVLVLGVWLICTCSSFLVACPGQAPTNTIGAHLIESSDATNTKKVYMVKNESTDHWQGVEVVVNGAYRATTGQVEPNGEVGLNILFDADGKRAPSNMVITDIELHVTDPEANFVMLRGGVEER